MFRYSHVSETYLFIHNFRGLAREIGEKELGRELGEGDRKGGRGEGLGGGLGKRDWRRDWEVD